MSVTKDDLKLPGEKAINLSQEFKDFAKWLKDVYGEKVEKVSGLLPLYFAAVVVDIFRISNRFLICYSYCLIVNGRVLVLVGVFQW